MPLIQLPFSKGLSVSQSEADWIDYLPVNMIAVPKQVLGAAGYMRSWPGLTKSHDSSGLSRGGVYNSVTRTTFRVNGDKLQEINRGVINTRADVTGSGYVPMAFSNNTTAFVADGKLYYWDGLVRTELRNWTEGEKFDEAAATSFDISDVIDVVRNRGRYIFCQKDRGTFGITDLQNEQRIEFVAPFYSAESNPDSVVAVDEWRDHVVAFGRNSIEFFQLTGDPNIIYRSIPALRIQAGIVGTGAKCRFLDDFAIVGGPLLEPPSIFLVSRGQYRELATRRIQKILREYAIDELENVYIEPVKFDAHDGFIVHLPRHTLFYDSNASDQTIDRWTILKTDTVGDNTYRGIYHLFDDVTGSFSCGDKRASILSFLDFSSGAHVGDSVEYMLQTPLVQIRNKRGFDFQVDSISGFTNQVERIAFSTTFDGFSFSTESYVNFNSPNDFTGRVLKRKLGYFKENSAFRLRWITSNATSIADFKVRIE